METKTITISKTPAGYGHYKLTVNVEDREAITHTTTRIDMIDRMRSDNANERVSATIEAIEDTLDDNGIEYVNLTHHKHPHFGDRYEADFEE